jgi:hypothetical protein
MNSLRVRVVGTGLPGVRFGDREHVHVGVQRGREVEQLVPGDAPRAEFDVEVNLVLTEDGTDYRGPYVQGKRGERFLYLSWGEQPPGGEFTMFRRAKLHLSTWEPELVAEALANDHVIEGSLNLSDRCGAPLCASVRPPTITWRAAKPE